MVPDRHEADAVARRAWRIEIEPSEPAADDVFLNVLDLGAKEDAAPAAAAVVNREGPSERRCSRGGKMIELLFYADGRASIDGRRVGQPVEPLRLRKVSPDTRRGG